ncbi:bile acid:sodium symporter family protein [Phytohabitans houttuyneae]|uniref:Bile acid:sodium symporter n=1 Tax=Phytohabitans houttuyneae TaxID=1076126 RepID=A0A6V8KRT1_9ACTN|nr:bile acid:sodium symporter family protein [Phytohabitans houttuyneae]GFJ84546.1 bile acid:sodium symporter [Phytohabitans houttuyneae]
MYILALMATVGVAALLPARGPAATVASVATAVAIGGLFFLYGARIAPRAAWEGARHWRLHAVVLACTFALFPLLALAGWWLDGPVLTPALYDGLLYLSAVPSTVQTSIAFTALAGGNVPAAIFSASFSNLAGVLLTPMLAAALLGGGAIFSAASLGGIAAQVVLPFAAGQAARPWLAPWLDRHARLLGHADRGAILLVVYTAFSAGVVAGVWHQLSPARLAALLAVLTVLLALVLALTWLTGRLLAFDRPDRVTIVFCGSKKSMATGLPMAAVMFGPAAAAVLVVPLILFHQIQFVVCAILARRWGR